MDGFVLSKPFASLQERAFHIWDCNGMEPVSNLSLCQVGKEPTGIINLLTFRHEVMVDWKRDIEEVKVDWNLPHSLRKIRRRFRLETSAPDIRAASKSNSEETASGTILSCSGNES